MSIDRSLKSGGMLGRHRNVLTRAERVAKLSTLGKFDSVAGEPLGLPKVANRKLSTGSKASKKAAEPEAEKAGGTATPAAEAKAADNKGAAKGAAKKG